MTRLRLSIAADMFDRRGHRPLDTRFIGEAAFMPRTDVTFFLGDFIPFRVGDLIFSLLTVFILGCTELAGPSFSCSCSDGWSLSLKFGALDIIIYEKLREFLISAVLSSGIHSEQEHTLHRTKVIHKIKGQNRQKNNVPKTDIVQSSFAEL